MLLQVLWYKIRHSRVVGSQEERHHSLLDSQRKTVQHRCILLPTSLNYRSRDRMDYSKLALLVVLLSYVERCWSASCVVDSFKVKADFDPKRYSGKWYALQKKDPEGLFLQDNISAEYTIDDDGTMSASSKGRVTLFGFWVVCADMAAQYTVPDPSNPGKMFMTYQGLASYLSSGGDNYWVIDTDYDNYAITYACRTLKEDGSCDDGYSLIFSRNPRGLPPAIQRIVRQKQEEICMAGQFEPVLQSGAC
ncbi:hypothetical protein COCON_G00166230 [Conger conger]|uniref:Lipocalin/cytosolic fatty-acid binding domain-containing protein n=2 Tax=Conger conger TaxID=82655 RepID=A0A9Q1HTP6_CONCO|nr:hypothetical protein COCON_G00166230 [Conger conger]